MSKPPSTSGVENALADAPATLEQRAWIGAPVVIEEKRDPVTGEVQMWNGRPVLKGRHLTIDEWEQLEPERAQEQLVRSVRNEDDPNPPKLNSPPMPPVIRR
jgi:hypothetical protein